MERTAEKNQCKGCERNITVSDEQIARMIAKMRPNFSCVSDERYEARLKVCAECSHLMESHTCSICGCIVQVRALIEDQDCPHYDGSKW